MLQHPRTGSQRTASATRLHHIRHRPALVQSSSGHRCKASCLGPSHTGGDSRHGGKCRRQATVQAERQIHATNVCIRTPSNTHRAVQRVLFHIWQSLETRGQIVKMVSSSESSDGDSNLVFCCRCSCCNAGESRKGP